MAAVFVAAAHPPAGTAQAVREFGVQGLVATSDPAFFGGGAYGALRLSPRGRLAVTADGGSWDGRAAFRGELLGHFLLDPFSRRGVGVYAGGGVALLAGPAERGYAVLVVGVEGRPGGPSGWSIEAGVGGGARITAGWRWRWGGQR